MPKNLSPKDVLNTVYGSLTVIEDLGTTKGVRFVITRCVCGAEKKHRLGDLRRKTRQVKCECLRKEGFDKRFKKNDFIPEGSRLTFLRLTNKKNAGNSFALYKCECGKEKEIRVTHAKMGKVRSCGCLVGDTMRSKIMTSQERLNRSLSQQTHGLSKHPLYRIFFGIIKRCEDINCNAYPYYGGRGVYMCPEWRKDFKLFFVWALSKGWKKGLHIDKDKIPKELGTPAIVYSPEMCSVLTMKENMNAVCSNVDLEYLGRKQTISQWANEFGVSYKLFWARLNRGWSIERSLSLHKTTTKESGILNRKIILNEDTGIFYFGVKEAAEAINQSTDTLFHKLCGLRNNNTPLKYV